jgi:hypothetical protein
MERKRGDLEFEARLVPDDHARIMYGEGQQPTPSRKRETILATIAARDAQEDLSFHDLETLLQLDARHTAWLQWLLDRVTPGQPGAGQVVPSALSSSIDDNTVSMIKNAIALTLATSINELPRYSDFERSPSEAARQFEAFRITPDPSPQDCPP